MLELLREHNDGHYIVVNEEFHKDLNWFCVFLTSYNGVTMYDPRPFSKRIYLDACLTGFGCSFDNFVYTMPLPSEYCTFNIVHLEMLNMMVAFKIWGHLWADHRIQIN